LKDIREQRSHDRNNASEGADVQHNTKVLEDVKVSKTPSLEEDGKADDFEEVMRIKMLQVRMHMII
jgi:hypothetical protein